jgi:hypothetical protein
MSKQRESDTPPSLTLLCQMVIGRSTNAWLIERGDGPIRNGEQETREPAPIPLLNADSKGTDSQCVKHN